MTTEHAVHSHDDEIDLFDLLDDIKSNMGILIGVTFVVLVLSVAYAFGVKPTYQAQSVIKETLADDLVQLNQEQLKDIYELKEDDAFLLARKHVLSDNLRKEFYNNLLENSPTELKALLVEDDLTDEQNYLKFSERFSFDEPKAKDRETEDAYLKISFDLKSQQYVAQVLRDYIAFVLTKAEQQNKNIVERLVSEKIGAMTLQAEKMRVKYLAEKNKRLLELQEANKIAQSVNQSLPIYSKAKDILVGSQPPLYMMGEKALSQEIELLNKRSAKNAVSEDAYVAGLPELLFGIESLQNLNIDWQRVHLAKIDADPVTPKSAIKPKKALVVAVGGLAGVMLGIMAALLAAASARRSANKAE